MKRHEAIEAMARALEGDELVVSSNGMITRELFTIADRPRNFYMIGSMGLASSIALGLALSRPESRVVVIEGDGNVLMNLGSMATIGHLGPSNLTQVVLDNEAHDSTGGQATASSTTRLEAVARAAGYRRAGRAASTEELGQMVVRSRGRGPALILVKVEKGSMKDIGRVTYAPEEIRSRFQESLGTRTGDRKRTAGRGNP